MLKYEDIPEPAPKPNEAVVKIDASGVNFIDIYQRMGIYKLPLPTTLGLEAEGTVTAVGPEVKDLKAGDRVAWTSVQGAYAQYCAVPADRWRSPRSASRTGSSQRRCRSRWGW